jgi:hypothetical protein
VIVSRRGTESIVMLPLEEWEGLKKQRTRSDRSGILPEIERFTLPGGTPALHSRSPKAIKFWRKIQIK